MTVEEAAVILAILDGDDTAVCAWVDKCNEAGCTPTFDDVANTFRMPLVAPHLRIICREVIDATGTQGAA